MEKVGWRKPMSLVAWLIMVVQLLLVTDCSVIPSRKILRSINNQERMSLPGVRLHILNEQVVMDNGIVQVTLSRPDGMVTGIRYNGIDNVLEIHNEEGERGYWDINWNEPEKPNSYDRIIGKSFKVIMENENQVELSFTTSWNPSVRDSGIPLNIDERFIMLRGSNGFYSYAIYERLEGWPDLNVDQTRIVFKLQQDKFHYMAVSDERQRIMPMPEDRQNGKALAYPEAVLLTNPTNPELRGEVDDKYQYSCENKDNRVHGWISYDPPVGFWMITPSNEFRTGGPVKQDLTSHVGPTTLSVNVCERSLRWNGHGNEISKWRAMEKVFGPVFIHLNSVSAGQNPRTLWEDAKKQMVAEVESWPYSFPVSKDFPSSDQRGTVTGQLVVRDGYISKKYITAGFAHVGLASPGEAGSWQNETKGYQFWVQADIDGNFLIRDIRAGNYNLYAWVPGFIGDYRYDVNVIITPGSEIKLDVLVYEPPRDGPTLWEIGIPDRSAAEFYVPYANPKLTNQLYTSHPTDRFRQYGLWERYTDLYPDQDLIYTVGLSNYRTDWFFAHVTRNLGDMTYKATTWQILFELKKLSQTGTYKLRVALASATNSRLEVRFNDPNAEPPHFSTGLIGRDNAIARHGIHGLYWLYNIDVPSSRLLDGSNTIFLTQSKHTGPFDGIMYDYIRLEGPPEMN